MSLQAIYRYNIAHAISIDEEVSFGEVARRCSLDESDVRRLLRMATANYIFQETRKGYISHTAISQIFVQQPSAFQWMGYVCDELWPSEAHAMDAMLRWPSSQEPNETGFALYEPSGQSFFDILKHDKKRAQRLADSMSFLQNSPPLDPSFLVKDLQWNAHTTPEQMVDIGGSIGLIDMALLRAYPRLKCIVQDLPDVVENAVIPDDLTGRLSFAAHNFFDEQPVRGADVYLMRSVLHDWSDKYAIQILKKLIPALKDGARIILNEVCLPEPNLLPRHYEQLIRGYDLAMKAKFNSMERDSDGWKALLGAADAKFKLKRITSSPGSALSVIEVVWDAKPTI